jgi:hypothetical protein
MCQQVGDADDFLIFSVFAHPGLKFRYVEADGIQEAELTTFCQDMGTDGSGHGFTA